jgi:cbb3-type cytochrome oxidase maturation protein
MTVLFVILPLTLIFSTGFVAAYVWATRSGQLDDLETPAFRALHESAAVASGTKAESVASKRR